MAITFYSPLGCRSNSAIIGRSQSFLPTNPMQNLVVNTCLIEILANIRFRYIKFIYGVQGNVSVIAS